MKPKAENNREYAKKVLNEANINWKSFNDDMHWKIGCIDFWPTSGKWIDNEDDTKGLGTTELVSYLRIKYPLKVYSSEGIPVIKILTPDQMFSIAKKVKPMNLMAVCEALHKEIYG